MTDLICSYFAKKINIIYRNMLQSATLFADKVSMAFLVGRVDFFAVTNKRVDVTFFFCVFEKSVHSRQSNVLIRSHDFFMEHIRREKRVQLLNFLRHQFLLAGHPSHNSKKRAHL